MYFAFLVVCDYWWLVNGTNPLTVLESTPSAQLSPPPPPHHHHHPTPGDLLFRGPSANTFASLVTLNPAQLAKLKKK